MFYRNNNFLLNIITSKSMVYEYIFCCFRNLLYSYWYIENMLKLNSRSKKNEVIIENEIESVIGSIHGKIDDDEIYQSMFDIENDKQKYKKNISSVKINKTTKLNPYSSYNYLYCNNCNNKIEQCNAVFLFKDRIYCTVNCRKNGIDKLRNMSLFENENQKDPLFI